MSPAAPIPAGWLRAADIARRVRVPWQFARKAIRERLVPAVQSGNRQYADPQAVADLYSRTPRARYTGRVRKVNEPRCALDLSAYAPADRTFVLETLRLSTAPRDPAEAREYVNVFLSARRALQGDGKKPYTVVGTADQGEFDRC